MKVVIAAVLLVGSVSASAETFFKCVGPDGKVTLADYPCATHYQELQVNVDRVSPERMRQQRELRAWQDAEVERIEAKYERTREYIRRRTLENSQYSGSYRYRSW